MTLLVEIIARYVAVSYFLLQLPTIALSIWLGNDPTIRLPFGMAFAIATIIYILCSTITLITNINSPSYDIVAGSTIANLIFLVLYGGYITLSVADSVWKARILLFYCLQFGICFMLYTSYLLFKHNIGKADSITAFDDSVGFVAIGLAGLGFVWYTFLYVWRQCTKNKSYNYGLISLFEVR